MARRSEVISRSVPGMGPRALVQISHQELVAALIARGVAIRVGEEAGRGPRNLSSLLVLVWSYQQATRDANWCRNLLGLAGTAYSVREIVTRW